MKPRKRNRLKMLLTRYWPEKLIAFAAAVLLWFFVTNTMIGDSAVIQGIALKITPPEGYVLLSEGLPDVSLEVRGNEKLLSEAAAKDFMIELSIPAADIPPGVETLVLNLTPDKVKKRSYWLTVSEIRPQILRVRIDRKVTREKALTVVTAGALSKDFEAVCMPTPSVIQVTGPETVLRRFASIPLAPIPLDRSMTETFVVTNHPIDWPHPMLESDWRGADVTVNIRRQRAGRTFSDLPVCLMEGAAQSKWRIADLDKLRASVKLGGTSEALQVLSPHYLRVFADLASADSDSRYTFIPLRVWCADPALSIESVTPAKVRVEKVR